MVVKHLNGMLREAVESPSLEGLKRCVGTALRDVVLWLEAGKDLEDIK